MVSTGGTINEAVSQRFSALSPTLQRAAEFVLDNPEEIATRSLRHIAREADMTPTTFSRLARAIGCDSYDAMRDMCRGEISRGRSRFAEKALRLVEANDAADGPTKEPFLIQQAAAAMTNIRDVLQTVDPAKLEKAARTLARARSVALVGAMSAAPLIDYAGYLATMAMPNWRSISYDRLESVSSAVSFGPGDAALLMTLAPYSARTVRLGEMLREQGVHMVVLTDDARAPVAEIADDAFFLATESPHFFPSHVAAMVVLESLLGIVVREAGASAQRRIADVERHAHELGEYWRA